MWDPKVVEDLTDEECKSTFTYVLRFYGYDSKLAFNHNGYDALS